MSSRYNHKLVDNKWQNKWNKEKVFETKLNHNKKIGIDGVNSIKNVKQGHIRGYVRTLSDMLLAPSSISSSASLIAAEPIVMLVNVPAAAEFAPITVPSISPLLI